jgi:TolB-like protein
MEIDSVAVLPFENKSGNADSEYLSDGLTESLIYRLSQLPNLKVSPTGAVLRYKGATADAIKAGTELGVSAVMSGRMVQRGDSLTLSVELVDVRSNKLLWGEQYQRKMSELLATQREIAAEIANKLQLKLNGDETKGLTKHYTNSNEAYQLYLKGRYYWNKRDEENLKKAIEQFKGAADSDPNFALAFSGLADCYNVLPFYTNGSSTSVIQQAKAYAQRALEIDDSLAEAHTSLA